MNAAFSFSCRGVKGLLVTSVIPLCCITSSSAGTPIVTACTPIDEVN